MKKGTNPLYVVTNKGRDVEAAQGFVDALIKKWGLQPYLEMLDQIFNFLVSLINQYSLFIWFKDFFDQMVKKLELITRQFSAHSSSS